MLQQNAESLSNLQNSLEKNENSIKCTLQYFSKDLEDLTPSEAAFLAALPKAPNNYHPIKKSNHAIEDARIDVGIDLAQGGAYVHLESDPLCKNQTNLIPFENPKNNPTPLCQNKKSIL